jgi:peptidase E
MTKYVLVGGHPWKVPDGGKSFVEELVRGFPDPVRVLLVPFARPKKEWERTLADDREFFAKHLPEKTLEIKLADEHGFLQQVRWTKVILLKGGTSDVLVDVLKRHPDWERELAGKTLAGSSAGADVISRTYFDLDSPGVRHGLALLPISVLVHYRSNYNSPNVDWNGAEAKLKAADPDAEFVPLREGEFRVFEK